MFPPVPLFAGFSNNEFVQPIDSTIVLDLKQLRDITMDDEDLMRELLAMLLDDTGAQINKLEAAINQADYNNCARLAHYCKGACGNVGANATAAIFQDIERQAKELQLQKCSASLISLAAEMERLRTEIASV